RGDGQGEDRETPRDVEAELGHGAVGNGEVEFRAHVVEGHLARRPLLLAGQRHAAAEREGVAVVGVADVDLPGDLQALERGAGGQGNVDVQPGQLESRGGGDDVVGALDVGRDAEVLDDRHLVEGRAALHQHLGVGGVAAARVGEGDRGEREVDVGDLERLGEVV